MSLRFQAKSRLLSRFNLSHRLLFITLVVVLALGVGISKSSAVRNTLSTVTGISELAAPRTSKAGAITVHAAGRGKPFMNLQDGRSMQPIYRGESTLANALQSGAALARTLATADFRHIGIPDVVAGFAFNGAGTITVQRGNPEAFTPDSSVLVRMQQGYNPDSLLPEADVYAVPVSPDFSW